MNLDGDMGNVRVLQRRAEWRGIAVEVLDVGPAPADLARCDLVFFGGGQDRDQSRIFEDFADHKRASLQRAVDEGTDGGAGVCGGYQLLEHAYVDMPEELRAQRDEFAEFVKSIEEEVPA